jgi:uncharacterized membrane protein
MLSVTLYTRKDCHLCEDVKKELASLQKDYPHRLAEVDIDSDIALLTEYSLDIPVIEVGPYRLKAPISRQNLIMTLGAARDRDSHMSQIHGEKYKARVQRGRTLTGADRVMHWISRHYLALLNIFIFLYFSLPFLAPTLMKVGAPLPAQVIYKVYSPLCHQFGFRSFFLYGEQPFYPLEETQITGVKSFEQVTGFVDLHNPAAYSRLQARNYIGDQTVGYKVALCERDVAIYAAIFLFGIIYAASGRRIKGLHWMLWIILGMLPIGLDGFSQIFSQFDWAWLSSIIPYRESTPALRVFTGALFGLTTAWFAYPSVEESMNETRQFFIKKIAVIQASEE